MRVHARDCLPQCVETHAGGIDIEILISIGGPNGRFHGVRLADMGKDQFDVWERARHLLKLPRHIEHVGFSMAKHRFVVMIANFKDGVHDLMPVQRVPVPQGVELQPVQVEIPKTMLELFFRRV
ncbi:unknown [Clostridium sp. CAG:1024]|nr:unknown [Clostridium sp. CAG:1024]